PGLYSPIDGTATSAFGGMFALALSLNDFNAFVELLQTQGNVQVLSSPRVSTVNNQKAVIKVGTDAYFITDVKTDTTVSAGGTTNSPSVEFKQFFSGVALAVTPQINEEGDVILHIHPSVTDVTDEIKQFTFAGGNFSVPLANSKIRESDSVVRAKNRQIVVIGGLMKNETTEHVASVPLLGDIPFFGALFRHTQQISRKSELVILLRPVVIDSGDNSWANTLSESADNFRNMNRGFHYGGKSEIFGTLGEEWPN
ncbi:MAG TPA: pilus (MSHA type) biogenesis protein MshL, partial [Gammaproteobacteria bacterium]